MRMPTSIAVLSSLMLLAAPAHAHPHVFVQAGATLIFDASGKLAALRISRTYDEFTSLMLITEQGLDADGDGVPERERLRDIIGWDDAGTGGHVALLQNNQPVALASPREQSVGYRDGRIVTSHLLPLRRPMPVGPEDGPSLRLYDPEYFVAYETPDLPTAEGRRSCRVARSRPKPSGQSDLLAALQSLDTGDASLDIMRMSDVGISFADTFVITCR